MAFKIKVIDTNFNEHIHLINKDSCILIDEKCSGLYKDYYALHTKDQVRDAIYDLDMDEEDCGFEKVDEDDVINDYMEYQFDVVAYMISLSSSTSTGDKLKIKRILNILKEDGHIKGE
jgi:hypothetical protein